VDFDQRRLAHVGPRIRGRVVAVHADLGDDVRRGTALVTLDSIELGRAKAEYLSARAEEELARRTLEREERLFQEKITTEQAVLEARAAQAKALVSLRAAEETLRLLGLSRRAIEKVRYGDPRAARFQLTAPIEGRVVEKHVVIGELIDPEEKVFTIADLSKLWIWVDVYEQDMARVHLEDSVEVRTRAVPGKVFFGRVAYVADEVDADTRAVRARIDLDNREGLLKPGMFAEVVLSDPHAARSERLALAVPPGAVQRDGGASVVFVEVGPRRYERRVVRTGARTDTSVEIVSGLDAGERVVVEGAFLLKSELAKGELGEGHEH
jgi:cobalt-zinc-cadmium efflux system membrane fusion protein